MFSRALLSRQVPRLCRGFSTSEVGQAIPINIYKTGTDPVYLEDSEYPEWLFSLTEPLPTERELEVRKDEITWEEGGKRLFKLKNRTAIKAKNDTSDVV
mmetsp:Transcript_13447/g.21964  ORF Transcript_13447/g.21964 Transcript_13447/m.21964 type:complete len:99 (+) Transcript_13447:93-389(+)